MLFQLQKQDIGILLSSTSLVVMQTRLHLLVSEVARIAPHRPYLVICPPSPDNTYVFCMTSTTLSELHKLATQVENHILTLREYIDAFPHTPTTPPREAVAVPPATCC
ncbi:hypothetical protein PR048_011015 [Dryococelus australis]|uniref:Uncharacterized protein n=1 Tax=Dryococelus australis TaxID=614101 RepID=A0ABQ9HKG4_9NEOP|nr:hypothetical protein PR048_011015 [Dryococelus australis]